MDTTAKARTEPEPAPAPAPAPRVLIVSSVRNEGAHITRVADALAAQRPQPTRWIVIDDGSTDDTVAQLETVRERLSFLTLLRAPAQAEGARDRLAQAVEACNFNLALAQAGPTESYTHIMKLDGDIELPPDYLRTLLERFAADPHLGLAGGVLAEPTGEGKLRHIRVPPHHVHGALKCWTNPCFTAIGGVSERLGWDTIDETYARMRGFHTCNFTDLVCVHHRPLASADGALRGHARHGECAYIVHYTPTWVTLRAVKVAGRRPRGLSGMAFMWGYVSAAVRGVPRVQDPDFRSFTRRELRARMLPRVGMAR